MLNIQLPGSETDNTHETLLLPTDSLQYYTETSLTFHIQNEALFDGHFQGVMRDTASKLFARLPERSLEVEESWQRVGPVLVMFVAGQQDVIQYLGQRSTNPLAWRCRVLLVPNYLHIQGVIAVCLTHNFLLLALQQWEGGSHIEGDTRRLLGEKEWKM